MGKQGGSCCSSRGYQWARYRDSFCFECSREYSIVVPRVPVTIVYVLTGLLACISLASCAAYSQQAKVTVSLSSRPEVPVLSPSRAAALLQQEMDSESRVGVCDKVSLLCPQAYAVNLLLRLTVIGPV